jgi:hypothetical protein
MNLPTRTPLSIILLGLLGACGAPTQDGGSPATLSGLAVDGYVAGATVYLDINGNALLDAYEPRALTDSKGYFGIDENGNDYCNSSSSSDLSHCLRTGDYSGSQLRIEGGIDTLTGEPFQGVLSRTADASGSQVASPLTSLMGNMSSAQVTAFLGAENTAAGTSLGLGDLKANPLDISTSTSADQNHLIRTAWLVHKSAAVIAAELKRHYTDAAPANKALANDFTPYVYRALVSTWEAAGNPDMQSFLNTAANITDLIDGAAALINTDGGSLNVGAIDAAVQADMTTRISKLITLIDDAGIFTLGGSSALTRSDVEARGRAIEVLTLILSKASPNMANVDAAIADLVTAPILLNLASSAADVAQIATDYEATGAAVTDYSGRSDLGTALAGAGVNGSTPTTLNDGIGGTADLTIDTGSGTVNIDVSSIDVDNDGNPDNVSLPGTITAINDYTSVMTLDVMGSQQTVILETDASGNLVFDTSTMTLEDVDLGTFTL